MMNVAVMKKVRGQNFQLDVLEELGLIVTDAMRARFAQIDAERAYNALSSTPTRRRTSSGCVERRREKTLRQ